MKILVRTVLSGAVLLACGLSVFGRPQSRREEMKELSEIGPLLSSRDSTAGVQDPYSFKPVFITPSDADLNFAGDTNSNTLPGTQYLSLLPTSLDGNYDYASVPLSSPVAPTTPDANTEFPTQLEPGSGQIMGSVFPSNSVPPSEGLVTTNELAPLRTDTQSTDHSPLLTPRVVVDLVRSLEKLVTTKFCFWQLQGDHEGLYRSAVGNENSQWSDFFSGFNKFSPGLGFIRTDSNELLVVMSLFRKCIDDSEIVTNDGSCGELDVLRRIAKDPAWFDMVQPLYDGVYQEGPVEDDAGLKAIGTKYIGKKTTTVHPHETD